MVPKKVNTVVWLLLQDLI